MNITLVAPDMVQPMLTTRCNIRCRICDAWKQSSCDSHNLTLQEFNNLIEEAAHGGQRSLYFKR